jgi:hypothetical protein
VAERYRSARPRAALVKQVNAEAAVLDGELVVVDISAEASLLI